MEILIVLAIISLLAAISYPCYTRYMIKTRRLEAETMLSGLSAAMEQYHIEHGTYQDADLADLHFPKIIAAGNYRLSILHAGDNTYLIAAKPRGAQALQDADCAELTLNDKAEKKISGTGTVEECW